MKRVAILLVAVSLAACSAPTTDQSATSKDRPAPNTSAQSASSMPSQNPESVHGKDALFVSCMEEVPSDTYCRCMADGVFGRSGISDQTKSRLIAKFTKDLNVALDVPPSGKATVEFEALGSVYVDCLNKMMP